MKNSAKIFYTILFVLSFCLISATVPQECDEYQRAEINIRSLSPLEQIETKERRAKEAEKREQNESEEAQGKGNEVEGFFFPWPPTLSVKHPCEIHAIASVSPTGDIIELEDGSIWKVHCNDSYNVTRKPWVPGDTIRIIPNTQWFSSYDYELINENVSGSVRAVLSMGPYFEGPYARWVEGIDHQNHIIYLNDGSVWEYNTSDSRLAHLWVINDTIIVGSNYGWFKGRYTNILINVSMNHYIEVSPIR